MTMGSHPERVFISYARKDKDRFVLEFARRLRAHGVDAWIDIWEMLPGDSLVDKVFEEGIKNARAMIIVLSQNSVDRPWVREELNTAFLRRLSGKLRIIPVVIDDCEIPEALRSTLWEKIGDLTEYDEEFQRIMDSIYSRRKAPPLGGPAEQVRRQKLRDDLEADRELDLSSSYTQRDLETLIQDKYEPPLFRLQALTHYLSLDEVSSSLIDKLLLDPDKDIRRIVFQTLHSQPRNELLEIFDVPKAMRILKDPDQEVAIASARLVCDLSESGRVPVDILTDLNRHRYWLVRRNAIDCIIKSNAPNTLELLNEFRTTSYHVSQQLIRDYIEYRFRSFNTEERALALDILRGLSLAKHVSKKSKSKNEELIKILQAKCESQSQVNNGH